MVIELAMNGSYGILFTNQVVSVGGWMGRVFGMIYNANTDEGLGGGGGSLFIHCFML